jgi:hypothetical protein
MTAVDNLAGCVVAVVGLREEETVAIVRALHTARAFPCVLNEGDSVPVPTSGAPFDLVAIDASLDWNAEEAGMPVLFVGDPQSIERWTRTLHDPLHDFLLAPCNPEEFLLRAGCLVATH